MYAYRSAVDEFELALSSFYNIAIRIVNVAAGLAALAKAHIPAVRRRFVAKVIASANIA
jgi:hypothetical protein